MGPADGRSLVDAIEDDYSIEEDPTCAQTNESLEPGDQVYLYLRGDAVEPGSLGRGEVSAVERTIGDDIAALANKDQLVVAGTLTGPRDDHGPSGEQRIGIEDVSVVDASAGS